MERSIGSNHFGFGAGLHGLCEDGITVIIVEHHDVFITATGSNGESASLVGVDLSCGFNGLDEDMVGADGIIGFSCNGGRVACDIFCSGLCGDCSRSCVFILLP